LTPAGGWSSTDDLGRFRLYGLAPGEYYVNASSEGGFMMGVSDSRSGFAATFYPGTPSITDAQRVAVAAGSENLSVNFALQPARTLTVSGTAMNSEGRPLSQGFIMVQEGGKNQMSFTVTEAARSVPTARSPSAISHRANMCYISRPETVTMRNRLDLQLIAR
jgi:hypothetical protein